MDQEHTDKEFAKLAAQLSELNEVEQQNFELTLAQLSDFCDLLSGLTSHINRYITMALAPELENPEPLSREVVMAYIAVYELTVGLTESMCDIVCGEDNFDDEEDEDASNN